MGEEEWDVPDSLVGDFTEGAEPEEMKIKEKVTPKVTDVPFETKPVPAPAPKEEGGKAKRYKEILLGMGFAKKEPQDGSDKESYSIHIGDMVVGRTFTEKAPNGKFWAIKGNKFLDEDEVKMQVIVKEFYDIRAGKKQLTLSDTPSESTDIVEAPIRKEGGMVLAPNRVINEAQVMATALYHVVEKQHLYMDIQGKKYLQLEAWQLLGKFCNVHGVVETVQPVEYFGAKGFESKAIVRDSDGVVIAAAEAICMDDEPNWKGKPLFQLKSMAQTRALSKAFRSSLSFIVSIAGYAPTPLEEMDGV